MPAIRLADIPNAGPQALGPSTNILAPRAAQLGGAAAVSTAPLDRAARGMITQTLELDAYSQEARAMGRFADSIGGLGDVAAKWGQKFAEAKDSADISRAETLLQAAWEKQQNDQLGTPVEKWGELWNRNQEEGRRRLSEIKLSNNAAERVMPYFDRWSTLSTVKLDGLRKKEEIKGFRRDIEANAMAKVAAEDFEGAFSVLDDSAKKGVHTPEEVTLFKSRLLDDVQRKAKSERNANVASKTLADPIAVERDLADAVLNGTPSTIVPELTDKADQVRAYDAARAEATRYRQRLDDNALDLILTGQLSTEKEVRDLVGDALPEKQILPLLKALSDTPVQREKALSLRPMVYAMADSYNPENDDETRSEYFKIRDTIFQLPSDQREEPLAMLRKARDEKADPTPLNVAKGQLKDLFDAGQFGSWAVGDDKKPKNEQEWNNYIEAGRKYAGHKSALENWAKNNPREASDPNKVYEQFNRNLTYERQLQKFQKEKSRWRFPWEDAAPVAPPAPPINPDDVMQKIKSKSSLGPKATKKQIEEEVRRIDFETPLPEMPS
jgi:ribosomal protein S20